MFAVKEEGRKLLGCFMIRVSFVEMVALKMKKAALVEPGGREHSNE